jgi:hypothetical protein
VNRIFGARALCDDGVVHSTATEIASSPSFIGLCTSTHAAVTTGVGEAVGVRLGRPMSLTDRPQETVPPKNCSQVVRGSASCRTVCGKRFEWPSFTHQKPIKNNRDRLDVTAYNRSQRTARFPVNIRESEGFRRHSARTKNRACTLQGVAGSNPVSPTTTNTKRSPPGGRFVVWAE